MKRLKTIHFVGIKGVGMTPLAIIAKEAGIAVTGSDVVDEFITDEPLQNAGIVPLVGFSADHIKNVDLVITTGAHGGFDNKEVKAAKEKGIKVITQGEAAGLFMSGEPFGKKFIGISVAGSHGKTTTTAMVATILEKAGMNPSYVIGTSTIPSLKGPGHFGKGKYFIAEADEYATEPTYDKTPKFLWQHPDIAIFTNIELDHPDLFPTIDAIRDAFLSFANSLSPKSTLIVCGDDEQNRLLLREYNGRVITYGFSSSNMYVLKRVYSSDTQTFFWIEKDGSSLGEFAINVAGEHNAANALAAVITAIQCGLSIKAIQKTLPEFVGSKRRFEQKGILPSGALLFDDYAHHPTEIKKTLAAFRKSYPTKKIVCIFQPHTYSRTKKLFEEFISSFNDADEVIINSIYPSLREEPDSSISSELLVSRLSQFHHNAVFLPQLTDVVKYINQKGYSDKTIVVTMGAGDIYKMSAHTTFKLGGPAEYYFAAETIEDLVNAVTAANAVGISLFIFGGGSNIIVADKGIKGLVVKNNCRRFGIISMIGKIKNQKIDVNKALVYAEGGVIMNQLVRYTIEQGFSGLEYQLGLPGTVGAGVFLNSNFPKKSAFVGDAVYKVKLITREGQIREEERGYFRFAYDKSILQETGEIVLSVIFRLTPEDKKVLWEKGMEALQYRNETQPKGASAGCTFRNIGILAAMQIPTPGRTTSAGYLIDKAGLKGKRIGEAMISDKHANFILNMGNARSSDVVALVDLMKTEVRKKFGVDLTMEVYKVGF